MRAQRWAIWISGLLQVGGAAVFVGAGSLVHPVVGLVLLGLALLWWGYSFHMVAEALADK